MTEQTPDFEVPTPGTPTFLWNKQRALQSMLLRELPAKVDQTNALITRGNSMGPTKRIATPGYYSALDVDLQQYPSGAKIKAMITRPNYVEGQEGAGTMTPSIICPEIIAKHLTDKTLDRVPFDTLTIHDDDLWSSPDEIDEPDVKPVEFSVPDRNSMLNSGNYAMWQAIINEDWTAINNDPHLYNTLTKWVHDFQMEYKSPWNSGHLANPHKKQKTDSAAASASKPAANKNGKRNGSGGGRRSSHGGATHHI